MGMLINPYIQFASEPTEAFSDTLSTDQLGLGGITFRVLIDSDQLSGTGSSISVSFQSASADEGFAITQAYIGHSGASAPDFDGSQVQLLFGGSSTKSISVNTIEASDFVSFSYDSGKDLIVSFGITAQEDDGLIRNASSTGVTGYTKSGLTEIGDTSISGMTNQGAVNYAIPLIEVK